jgi:hypothetical protein
MQYNVWGSALQVLETYVGISVIRNVLKGFEPFPDDLFRTSLG